MTEKYVLEVNTDHETGEEHCTVLKTDGTTDMNNWITIINALYTHHSILEPLVNELNKIYNGYSDTEKYAIKLWKENQQLKKENQRLSEQKHIYKQDWKHLCIDKELLDSENEQLKIRNKGKQAFIDKQDKIIKLLYNQCKDFKEILDDSNITYPIDERLNKFFEKGVKL